MSLIILDSLYSLILQSANIQPEPSHGDLVMWSVTGVSVAFPIWVILCHGRRTIYALIPTDSTRMGSPNSSHDRLQGKDQAISSISRKVDTVHESRADLGYGLFL